ncbi:MAG: SH3 domain-containing protein [Chloroflexi bacterium]|nr:SH3 domain-containing protein [Chloroflexota bacterium]
MIRRILTLVSLLIVAVSVSMPPAILAGDPPNWIPPLRADGPVVLPNGRVLPVKPAWVQESSVQAEMLAEHGNDHPNFKPGAQPRKLGEAGGTLGLAPHDRPAITPLALADPSRTQATLAATGLPNGMRKEVLGFLPYWMLDAGSLQWMQYQLVSTIAYFSVAAQSDGTLATSTNGVPTAGWSGWNSSAMTSVINAAHAKGVRVVLTVTMMAWDGGAAQGALLGNATARAALVNAIVAAVRNRTADGVNLDFEPVSTSLRDQYTSFVRQLKAGLVAGHVGSYLTICTMAGAATWSTGYDLAGLTASGAADAVFVMGYDYSWSGSSRAGGVAPMDSPYILDVRESVDDYLSVIPGAKIIWGVPYYGRTWLTTGNTLNAPTVAGASGSSKAYYYTGARNLAASYGRRWDDVGKVPWFAYYDSANGSWAEGYYDDAASLAAKYDMINQKNLAGTGMWTLLMDQGDNLLWGLLANKFVNDTTPPMGGITVLPTQASEAVFAVSWRATDVGSGVKSYSVQYHDRSTSVWVPWLASTVAKSAIFIGIPGHAYDFRVIALDYRGNSQPLVWSMSAGGPTLAVGGFGRAAVDGVNVRSGAGTGFTSLAQLSTGATVAVLGGPIASGGYQWYQVQFNFSEWPSADYPRIGWVAAGSGTTAWVVPTKPPNMITVAASAKPAQLMFGLGTHTAYQFSGTGAVTAAKSFTLQNGSSAPVNTRVSITNQSGTWFFVTSGVWAGYWVRQSSVSWLSTAPVPSTAAPYATFNPVVRLAFKMGTHTGYKFSSTGAMTAERTYTLSKDSSAATSVRRTLTNQSGTWFLVTSGVWAGYWVRASDVVYLG